MSKYIKSNFKSIFCVALAFCMLFSLFIPLSKIPVSANDTPAKMLYIKTSDSNRRLYQRAAVEVGETYYFSFAISSDITFTTICCTDSNRYNVNANIELISREEKGECAFYTYSYTIPEKDSNGNNMTGLVFFGIRISSACEGYFFSASLYNKNDANKTELFENPDFSNGTLDRWAWDWDIWFAPSAHSTNNVGITEWTKSDGATTLKVMDFDENLIKEDETPVTKKMLHIKTTDTRKYFYQRAAVEVGETYYFSVTLSSGIAFTPICRTNGSRTNIEANIQQVESVAIGECTKYTYSYTIPEKDTDGNAMTDLVFFGIRINEAWEGYFISASIYNKNDANKTELFENPDFSNGSLDRWAWDWDIWFAPASTSTSNVGVAEWTNSSGTTALKVMDLDESLITEKTEAKMLHFKYENYTPTDHQNELYQLVPVTKGETYHFTFGLSDSVSNFDMVCRGNHSRPGIDANVQQVSKEAKSGYSIYTYSYSIPETDSVTDLVFFGIRFKEACEGYFFNASVYKADDSEKTELLTNPNFSQGFLDEWALGWKAWFKAGQAGNGLDKWNNDKISVEVVDYDESLFGTGDGDEDDDDDDEPLQPPSPTNKVLYIKNSNNQEFYQRAPVTVGETYHFSFSVSDTIEGFTPLCRADEGRPGVEANITLVDTKDEQGYKTFTYSYTIPATDKNGGAMTPNVFFGIRFPAGSEGYFFNVALYDSKDNNKTELLANPNFANGFDKWALGWDKWFGAGDSALTEWTNNSGTTTVKLVDFDESLFEEDESGGQGGPVVPEPPVGDKMLYIKTSLGKDLYQRAYVEIGKTYYFTFSVSDSISSFTPVCYADSQRPPVDAGIELIETVDNYGYKTYTYSYTIPETDSKGNAMTNIAFFGIKLSSAAEGYFFNPSFKLKDSETELFDNPDFKAGLSDWAWGWDKWFRGEDASLKEWSNEKTTLKIMGYDDSLFEDIPTPVQTKKMLYIKTTTGKDLMQRIPVEIGQTYNFTFSLSNSISFFTPICIADDKRPAVDADIELIERVDKKGYTVYTYSYTIPEKDENGNPMSANAFIGIRFSGTQEGYFFDSTIYKADDKNKTEIFSNPDFKIGLGDWAWGWDIWFRGDNSVLDKWENEKTTLQLVDYDMNLLPEEKEKTPKMLYINTKSPKELMQRAKVKAGETYYFTFSLNDTITSFEMICRSDSQRSEIEADIKLIEEIDKDGYTTYTYSYTIPQTYINRDGKEVPVTDVIFFGVKPSIACEGYMFDVSLYKAGEKYKTELFENPDFNVGLDRWAWGWDVWFGHSEIGPAGLFKWNNEKTTLKIVDFSKKLIEEINKTIPGKRMVYFINGATSSHFAARVELEPGGEYYMQFSAFSTDEITIKITEDGGRQNIRGVEKELVSAEDKGNYTTYLYKFIMPEDLENNLVFAGPVIKYYSEGYIFDLSLYKADDAKKTNMWVNNSFAAGLDGWIWNWHAWFGYNTDSGTLDWTNGANTVQLVDFNLKKIDELIALLNVNDGQWWNPKDLIDESSLGTATLKGNLVDQNGNPISGVKLSLDSTDKSYQSVTDSKGAFKFNKFTEGFYELYVVDEKGNKVSTEYYASFADGDVITLKLVYDTSIAQGNPEAVGTVSGTAYTPQLKTVANLKIIIRGVGETVTDKDGNFKFDDIPVGEHELYTVLADGSEYVFRTVSVKENKEVKVKLKYDPSIGADAENNGGFNWLWVIIPSAVVVLAAGAVVAVIFIKKRKATNANK